MIIVPIRFKLTHITKCLGLGDTNTTIQHKLPPAIT